MCLNCGFYNGKQVLDLEAKNKARAERMAMKKEAINAQRSDNTENPVVTPTK
jgi:hypothetical protein